jgi:uncharacterized protein involved in high-affinity Fe2+ transport
LKKQLGVLKPMNAVDGNHQPAQVKLRGVLISNLPTESRVRAREHGDAMKHE